MSHENKLSPVTVNLHHVHLVTADMDTTTDFYTRHFGGVVVFDREIAGDRNVFMTIGSGRLHFFESRRAPPNHRNSFHHLGVMVASLDSVVERLRSAGVLVDEIVRTPGGGFAMTQGPDNVKIELFEVNDPEHRRSFISQDS